MIAPDPSSKVGGGAALLTKGVRRWILGVYERTRPVTCGKKMLPDAG